MKSFVFYFRKNDDFETYYYPMEEYGGLVDTWIYEIFYGEGDSSVEWIVDTGINARDKYWQAEDVIPSSKAPDKRGLVIALFELWEPEE